MQEKMIERDLLQVVAKNIIRKEIIAIRGPRQSGKSTLLFMIKNYLIDKGVDEKDITYLTLEDPNVFDEFAKDPQRYISSFINGKGRHYFLIDEVQYDKDSGKQLKLVYDTIPDIKLVITGSSTLDLSKIATFLVGRVFLYELLPLSFGEYLRHVDRRLHSIFQKNHASLEMLLAKGTLSKLDPVSSEEIGKCLEDYLKFGGYPAVVKSRQESEKIEVLKNIYITYLEKDVSGIFGVADMQTIRKIILNLALNIGNMLDYSSITSSTGIYYEKLMRYMSILEDTYVIKTISPFYKNRLTELRKNKKLYFFDTGMRNYLIQNFNAMDIREDAGRLAENFVAMELHRIANPIQTVNFWRTTSKAEVDFVFNSPNVVLPVEVKYSKLTKSSVEKSMRSFIGSYRPKNALVISRGTMDSVKIDSTKVYFIHLNCI